MLLKNGFDPKHLAGLFCREFGKNRTDGWGLSTYHAIARMVYNGISWDRCGAPAGSAGNGAAMLTGPFGLFPFESKNEMINATILVELSLIGYGPENHETDKRGISGYVLPSVAAALSIFLCPDPLPAL